MKIFTTNQIREIDFATLKNQKISEYTLVKRVANELVDRLSKDFIKHNLKILVFAGKGNNGNDAIAVATLLTGRGVSCELFVIEPASKGEIPTETREELLSDYFICTNSKPQLIKEISDIPLISSDCLIIDGIFGTGLSGAPKGIYGEVINAINRSSAFIISIDIPSGMVSDGPVENYSDPIIRANYTLTIEFPKLSFFLKESYAYTGEWEIVDVALDKKVSDTLETKYYMIDKHVIHSILKRRERHSHKGDYGHALLVAGSHGMAGAAILSARSAMRSGVGLLTALVSEELLQIMQISVPEALCSTTGRDTSEVIIPHDRYSAAAIGPGLNTTQPSVKLLESFLSNYNSPSVFDADAINILSAHNKLLSKVPLNSVFTPHPGEFRRLAGDWNNSYEAIQKQIAFSLKHKVFIVLKGAWTSISTPDGEIWFNSTGNPGMATAGSGDVLTGIVLALMSQGYTPKESALAGVFIHGLAGDIAAVHVGEEALIASDIIANLGSAIKVIKEDKSPDNQ